MLIRSSGPRAWPLFFQNDLVVRLNGETIKNVVEADDEAGYVVRYALDSAGKMIREGLLSRLKTERVDGTVVFTGTRRFSPDDAKTAAQAKRDRRAARNLRNANRAEVRQAGDA